MASTTTNLHLKLLGTSLADKEKYFEEWRQDINGEASTSNMQIIDSAYGSLDQNKADKSALDGKADKSALDGKSDKSSTVSTVAYDSTKNKLTKTINGATTDVFKASDLPVSTAQQNALNNKSDKSSTVSTVAYDSANKKITKTINGTTTDVVSVGTLVGAMDVITNEQIDALFE